MKIHSIRKRLARAATVLSEEGFYALGLRLIRRIARLLGRDDPHHREWLRRKSSVDMAFDEGLGIQTGGIQEIADLCVVGENARHGLSHIASDPSEFVEVMQALRIDFAKYSFVDLGSGKGRALILAAQFPFRRLIGVEFAAELVEQARSNFAVPAVAQLLGTRVELIRDDTTMYDFPGGPLVVYLFNPFGPAIIHQVAVNLLANWKRKPRPIEIVYVNPRHVAEIVKVGWSVYREGAGFALLRPAEQSPAVP